MRSVYDIVKETEEGTVMKKTYRVAVVGTGWRAEFYMRICQAVPDLFSLYGIWYHSENGRKSVENYNVPQVSEFEEILKLRPDFVVLSLNGAGMKEAFSFFSDRNIPMLIETFMLKDETELAEVYENLKNARVQFAEQYMYQPLNAARLCVAQTGVLGDIYHVRMSIPTHHHPASLVRLFLNERERLPVISAKSYTHKLLKGPGRGGDPKDEELFEGRHEIVTYDYGDKQAVNDFEDMQHRSFMRSNYFLVRGSRGEIVNEHVTYMLDALTPVEYDLKRVTAGAGVDLQGLFLRGVSAGQLGWVFQNRFMPARLYDDEIAVAECMYQMTEYLENGKAFYGIEDVLTDIYFALLTDEALKTGQQVSAHKQAWME